MMRWLEFAIIKNLWQNVKNDQSCVVPLIHTILRVWILLQSIVSHMILDL